jgi:tagaturonate reductase
MPGLSTETILQFGSGKFLRCFADLFVHQINATQQPAGRVVVVQSTGAGRAALFNGRGGHYHAAIRGLEAGRLVDEMVEVGSVSRALAADADWAAVLDLARAEPLQIVVSNVTEAGYVMDEGDSPHAAPPRSFPAKLLAVLFARFEAGLPGLTVLPCELLAGNADRLRALVLEQSRRWELPAALAEWIAGSCSWHNTLVDRIVSAPAADDPMAESDPLFAVAEPFAFWGIDGAPSELRLMQHPAVRRVEDLGPYYLRKVRILNGAHTALVAKARPLGLATVRQAVCDPRITPWLERLLFEEIVPTLVGRTDDPEGFARQTLERFANPFLEHRLADIALEHEVKVRTRLGPTCDEYRAKFGCRPKLLGEIVA